MTSSYFLDYLWLIPLFPLLSAVLMLFLSRLVPKGAVNFFCIGSVALSFLHAVGAALALFALDPAHRAFQQILFEWFTPGPIPAVGGPVQFIADWGYLLDPLSCVMTLVVTGVGLLIHIYSAGYLGHEGGYGRFFGYTNLFMFSMLTLVLANNLLLLFLGWQGVALCSYLLIGFRVSEKSASDAGAKAFIVNGVGDTGFLLGIFFIAATFGTIRFTSEGLGDPVAFAGINETLSAMLRQGRLPASGAVLTTIALLLLIGAIAKSALIPFHVWLAKSVVGPAPVSALIETATTITAGIYLVVRMNAIYQLSPLAMGVIAFVGTVTAIVAACLALAESNMQKVLAYSTMSQVGFMFMAVGVGAFSAGIFQLMTHAFSKALLFLGAGCTIHSLSGEQDLRKMGGLWNTVPTTSRPFLIASLAIAGTPLLAGFFSNDQVLGHVFSRSVAFDRYLVLWLIGLVVVSLTSFYIFRLLFLAFFGLSRVPPKVERQIYESPVSMTIPLMILATLAIVGGWFALPVLWGQDNSFEKFLEPVTRGVIPEGMAVRLPRPTLLTEWLLIAAMAMAAALGLWLAFNLYLKHPQRHAKVAASWPRLDNLLTNSFYVDEIYDALFVNRMRDLSVAFALFDAKVIDGFGVDGASWLARVLSRLSMWWDKWVVDGLVNFLGKFTRSLSHPIRMFQTGVFTSYAVFILLGLVILLAYYGFHMQALVRSLR